MVFIYIHLNCKIFTLDGRQNDLKECKIFQILYNIVCYLFFTWAQLGLFNDWQPTFLSYVRNSNINILWMYHGLNMRFHIVILYCANSIAMNMKGNRSASRDIKHWIMHNSYFCRPPKTFSFEVFGYIKINFFVPTGHKSEHKIFYKMKRTIEWI